MIKLPILPSVLVDCRELRVDRKHPGYKPPNLSVGSMLQSKISNLKSQIDWLLTVEVGVKTMKIALLICCELDSTLRPTFKARI